MEKPQEWSEVSIELCPIGRQLELIEYLCEILRSEYFVYFVALTFLHDYSTILHYCTHEVKGLTFAAQQKQTISRA